jgi:tetratricopeptide (TPR) repeat protein
MKATSTQTLTPALAMERAALHGIVVLALATLLAGCGMPFMAHKTAPLDAKPKAAKTSHGQTRAASKAEASRDPLSEAQAQLAQHPGEAYWPFRVAELQLAAGSTPAAEASLLSALGIDARYAPAMSLISKLYFDAGRHEEALRVLEPAVSHPEAFDDRELKTLLAAVALHQDALGRSDLAIETIRPIRRPDLHNEGSALVYVTLRGSYPDSANELADDVLHRDSGSAVNLNNYGITQLRAGDPRAARKTFLSAVDRDARLPGPYYNLAILDKFYLMDDASAQTWFSRYWELSHDDPDSLRGVFSRSAARPVANKAN